MFLFPTEVFLNKRGREVGELIDGQHFCYFVLSRIVFLFLTALQCYCFQTVFRFNQYFCNDVSICE